MSFGEIRRLLAVLGFVLDAFGGFEFPLVGLAKLNWSLLIVYWKRRWPERQKRSPVLELALFLPLSSRKERSMPILRLRPAGKARSTKALSA